MHALLFWIFAAVAIVASLLVVGQRNPMHSVLLLIGSFGALSGLYVLLGAPFVAAIQIIIYAGAIMVLFLFVVMLLNVPREEPAPATMVTLLGPTGVKAASVLSLVLAIEIIWALSRVGLWYFRPEPAAQVSSVANIGNVLFTQYAFAFEVTSILILAAMVGAVILARREQE